MVTAGKPMSGQFHCDPEVEGRFAPFLNAVRATKASLQACLGCMSASETSVFSGAEQDKASRMCR
jgi:hypothetical protein